jgi:hypothetical protein
MLMSRYGQAPTHRYRFKPVAGNPAMQPTSGRCRMSQLLRWRSVPGRCWRRPAPRLSPSPPGREYGSRMTAVTDRSDGSQSRIACAADSNVRGGPCVLSSRLLVRPRSGRAPGARWDLPHSTGTRDARKGRVRGELEHETGEISPDRGNHAIRVTGAGRTHPGIPRRFRYLVRHLACVWLGGRCGPSASVG